VMVNSGLLNNKWNANCDTSSIELECQKNSSNFNFVQ